MDNPTSAQETYVKLKNIRDMTPVIDGDRGRRRCSCGKTAYVVDDDFAFPTFCYPCARKPHSERRLQCDLANLFEEMTSVIQQLAEAQAEIRKQVNGSGVVFDRSTVEAAMQAVSDFGELQTALEQRDRLQAIVDKLPKTADGVRFDELPQAVFVVESGVVIEDVCVEWCRDLGASVHYNVAGYGASVPLNQAYSTRQAAQAALDKGGE